MFGDGVRAHRRRLGMTQEELAAKAGVSVRSIGGLEAGRVAAPRPPTVRLLADAFGLTGAERDAFCRSVADEPADRPAGHIVPAQLPSDVFGFTGRDDELTRLDALLGGAGGDPPRAVVITTVAGTAGVGKTALAVHWAHRIRDRFPDGQLYVNMRGFDPGGPAVQPAEVLSGFLEALGVSPQRIPADPAAQAALYRSALTGRRVLIVLDNASDADQVRPLLPGEPACMVVVTSRNRLGGLVAAAGAQPLFLDLLTTAEARELLSLRIGEHRVRAEPAAVADIIAACSRLPLALAITAARAATHPGFSLGAIAAELRDAQRRLDVLAGSDPATDVRAVFSWSYRTLSPAAARVFRLLALHPTPEAGLGAVTSLAGLPTGQVRPLLAELGEANLVAEPTAGRFACHDLLRDYARELVGQTDSAADRRAATLRVLDHYLHTALAADRLVDPRRVVIEERPTDLAPGATAEQLSDVAAAQSWFIREQRTLRAAVEQAANAGFDGHAWWLPNALFTFYDRQGSARDGIACHRIALAAAVRSGDLARQGYSEYALGYPREVGDPAASRTHLSAACDAFDALGLPYWEARALLNLGIVARRQGRYPEAMDRAEEALRIYREIDDAGGQGSALNNMGWCQIIQGNYEDALSYCRRAVTTQEAIGNQSGAAHSWDSVGHALHHLGRHEEAIACYSRALELFRAVGDRRFEAVILAHLGDAHQATGERPAAQWARRQALEIFTEIDHPDGDELRAMLRTESPPAILRRVR